MNAITIIITLGILLIPVILVVAVITHLNRNQWRRVQEMQGHDVDFDPALGNAIEGDVIVISNNQKIVPNAGGFAKVDLQVDVRLLGKNHYQASTIWLVDVGSLDMVLPGRVVPIKVDPQKPNKIVPNVPWAKLWIFGK
jgi:hypothetical protein